MEVEVESMDKAGNFIGWLHIEGVNLSVALVENALSKVHFTAERSAYYKTLVSAEDTCREKKEKVGSQNICLKKMYCYCCCSCPEYHFVQTNTSTGIFICVLAH